MEENTPPAKKKKRYYVYQGQELVKYTDKLEDAEAKVLELKEQNARYIKLHDNSRNAFKFYTKEPGEKNYRATIYDPAPVKPDQDGK